jgi:RimJ/RimL family protein N-acetyltransferase
VNVTEIPVLRGERVVVRPFRKTDLDDLAAGCADPVTQRFLPLLPGPFTRADAAAWIERGAPAALAAGNWAYGFADPDSERLIGGGGVTGLGQGLAEIGYWTAPWARGRGVAAEAARLLASHAFAHGTHRLVLHTHPENVASQKVAIAAGFTREGLARGAGLARDGGRYDKIVWARLATDPDGPSHRLLPDLPGGRLTDGVVSLTPLTLDDAADTHALRTLPEIVRTSVPPVAPSMAHIRRRCAESAALWLAGGRADLVIRDAASGTYAGEIGLYYFEPPTQQAMIGYSLRPEWRGRGLTTRAVNLVTQWAFDIGVYRVVAGTAPENLASQRVLQRAGFEQEGFQRARLPGPDGTRIDDIQWVRLTPTR